MTLEVPQNPTNPIVPFSSTEEQWSDLITRLITWLSTGGQATPRTMLLHLKRSGCVVPESLEKVLLSGDNTAGAMSDNPEIYLPPSLAVSPNIPLDKQTLEQLYLEKAYWEEQVATSPGFASAKAADSFRKGCVVWINKRENENAERR